MIRLPNWLIARSESEGNGPESDNEMALAWIDPPKNPKDQLGWDDYWQQQMMHGLGPPYFDMFCDDRELVAAMSDRGMKSVLCAGNGISMEPRVLAAAGFEVMAVDISGQALEIAQRFPPGNELLLRFLDLDSLHPGGCVEFVKGDLFDTSVALGPFDVVIERRTAQTYPDEERAIFLSALAGRLRIDGIFFSHCHDNRWRPRKSRYHATSKWFQDNGWQIWAGGPGRIPSGRVAWLFTTTG